MTQITCPECRAPVHRNGFAAWVWIVSIIFFPFGLLALLAGRKPSKCYRCGTRFAA